ncbi:MAG: hypothetical protein WCK08_07070 [Betaproteobacteria bacterium]
MNPSGGLPWHWRAWRSQGRWRGAREQIEQWLASVNPARSELLVLGASAGWMLPAAWLARFERVDLWDIDPWAPWLFNRRHGAALKAAGVRWTYHRADALANLPALLASHPQAAVYCDNLLGQLRFHAPAGQAGVEEVEQRLAAITRILQGREWGSVHDLLSGPALGPPSEPPAMRRRRRKDAGPPASDPWLRSLLPSGPWLDHLTDRTFPVGTAVHDIAWPFKPGYWHWLQAGWVHAPAPKISP